MAQRYYTGCNGDSYLTFSEEPGMVTEGLILNNIGRMMAIDDDSEGRPWLEMKRDVMRFYSENAARILERARLHDALVEISEEEAERIQLLSFEEWLDWEFQD